MWSGCCVFDWITHKCHRLVQNNHLNTSWKIMMMMMMLKTRLRGIIAAMMLRTIHPLLRHWLPTTGLRLTRNTHFPYSPFSLWLAIFLSIFSLIFFSKEKEKQLLSQLSNSGIILGLWRRVFADWLCWGLY